MNVLALGPSWLDPEFLIQTFGTIGILAIVFAESGLLIGFFLPGDSLLFTTGLLVATDQYLHLPLWLMCTMIVVAAVLGDQVGYLFGRKVGPALFRREDSRLFKQENVEKAHEFFEKHGPKSLVLARFVPIVRTFTPIVAGVSNMRYRSFVTFNIIGGVLWGAGVTLLGAGLGQIAFVRENIEAMLLGIVLLSIVPIVVEVLRARRKSRNAPDPAGADAAPVPGGPAPYEGGPYTGGPYEGAPYAGVPGGPVPGETAPAAEAGPVGPVPPGAMDGHPQYRRPQPYPQQPQQGQPDQPPAPQSKPQGRRGRGRHARP